MIPIARPQMGDEEKELVLTALSSGALAQGARVKELEEAFADLIGVTHAVATSSGTTALHLAPWQFALVNAGLVVVWLGLALRLGKRFSQMAHTQ